MARIEGLRIKNYRALKDITLGKLWNTQNRDSLTPMTAVIGKNGVGKSTLFDAFGFLSDCLKGGVEEACDARGRGGFDRLRSQGQEGSIEFQIYYKEDYNYRPITYELAIDLDTDNRPYVKKERLRQRRKGQKTGWPFSFLLLDEGKGIVWKGEEEGKQVEEGQDHFDLLKLIEKIKRGDYEDGGELVELNDKRKLGIATLGSLKQHPRISLFRRFIEGWYLSYFTPDAARSLPLAGPQKHLNIHGDNLGNVVQFMEREHSKKFQNILNSISRKIPGIEKISTEKSPDNRLLLKFNDRGFQDPFYVQQMSDGTLKVFAYLLLLEDPSPPPFICIEEPENGLYHKLLETLAQEFRKHATGQRGRSQIFITTHQPYFVDALQPEEVWILEKGDDGFSRIKRASDNPLIKNLVSEGLPLGSLWYSDYLDER
ncbi:MAG: AAA family ATPase [Microcystis sp. M53603_WE2]|jgi:predicted ATPase|uniref:AAA family ATPase n=1 Tax=unclassified Microcystis TaxID=2643300 RepID=UPI0022C9A2AE|nr:MULTISPECIES: AAA family ATPase [unclassified Microcystis]MCZ8363203.1 AAA family ATPase [Microcystis sp. LE19-251.1A]MDJ0545737.1 AAA family ATPase [Microcystis sp. M53601_WE4]MCZ8024000.1 AAA family ATPase [Microcystis sp. LE19-10.1B]MDJ0540897.1 AAA family ATPase [Microcystis sp. M53603_WE2]MDJ0604478.1 AAA family ATPase [Microcystis sp. M53602_WE12]